MLDILEFPSLSTLQRGQVAVIEHFDPNCSDQFRLEEMGLRVGELVTMLMPGCPCALAVGETRLMVRRDLLRCVLVSPL